MPYKFTFDFTNAPHSFFAEVALAGHKKGIDKALFKTLQNMIKTFRIQETTGLDLSDAIIVLQDIVDVYAINHLTRSKFLATKKRALLLPHCARKYMDSKCKAVFDPTISSYTCAQCSPDCPVNQATCVAKEKGYDVYVLPGASCLPKIFKAHNYDGLIGVACAEEAKGALEILDGLNVVLQGVPLIKNGCVNTFFNMETLKTTL
jgi:uncharacterized protein